MAKDSYNNVGAGDTPNCYHGKTPSFMMNEVRPGKAQSFSSTTVNVDIPKVASSAGYGKDMGPVPGSAPEVARPGGSQEI